ncbi:CHAT domain-containing protein [Streptomyces europaeiscabiei]|uniref:CHAT domain-containing protein n=1 Tax=Streptomyces europaeiscabiei TaxID=146819 RepID=UPI00076601A2|nr:CHAT domain-containing protein [Streptomyces europaeiscabiei]MDX3673333.1 CHAT domain-containing protein [Streptomyces europaeiscabiei]MDX3716152.1 CHAT domain-containing protein [Streptomyces europaeiscabiei]MDX3839615.1 CHAT domain-containing protein [Streptomyces europaeiscabiei]MDX3847837.1 CHAT domain-containing protein [Streptomyces europaeiscabiei]MDX3867041.1 CHAT domain-containing protein [Streptomyces europaeiscabiei]
MSTHLPVRVVQDPSSGFRYLPHLATVEPDLRVSFDILDGGRLQARMSGPALPSLRGGEHKAVLSASPVEVRSAAARLCRRWKQIFVDYQPKDAEGRPQSDRRRPYAAAADLRDESEAELVAIVSQLVRSGASVLFDMLFGGGDERVEIFRSYLAMMLAGEGLRIRFDSHDLHLPWPMLCLRPQHLADAPLSAGTSELDALFSLFLGHRHQIEHTGDAYQRLWLPVPEPGPVAVSLNHDTRIGLKTCASAVAFTLGEGTRCEIRTTYDDLVRDLGKAHFDEQLMYFWGHGGFEPNGSEAAQLVIRLSDEIPFDGHTVREVRSEHRRTGTFHPFVLLNACQAGHAAGDADRAFLGRVLVEHGAQGVLGPQIDMPQAFAAEYAREFVRRFLRGGPDDTAGRIAYDLSRHFTAEFRNPLGFAYALHCGMDARVRLPERTDQYA